MAIKTTTEQLEEVQTAITAVMGNQSYTVDGRTFTRADLSALHDRETVLIRRYNQEVAFVRPRVSTMNYRGNFN